MATRQPTPDLVGGINVLDDIFGTKPANTPEKISLWKIQRDGGTQMRAGLDEATVTEYFEAMHTAGAWGSFPPLTVFYDGAGYWLADGFHRYAAAMQEFGASLQAPCDIRAGTQRDAMLHAASANASHGLRRTNADKRRAVLALLQDPEWSQWSDGEIARRCAVSQPFVSGLRKDFAPARVITIARLPDEDESTHNGYESPAPATAPATRKGSDGRDYKVKPATVTYAQIYLLEGVIREIVCRSEDLRKAAKDGDSDWMWRTITGLMDGRDYRWKKSDLVQAINNVAAQKEVKEAADKAARQAAAPAPVPAPVSLENGKNLGDWTDEDWEAAKVKVVSAEVQAANQARATEAGELIDLYQRVIDSEAAYSRLTGDFVGTIAMKDALSKMQAGLKRLKEDLS
jgi:hypothetical protein